MMIRWSIDDVDNQQLIMMMIFYLKAKDHIVRYHKQWTEEKNRIAS